MDLLLWQIWGRSADIPDPTWLKKRQIWCVNSGGVNAALVPFWCQSKSSELTTVPWAATGSSGSYTEWGGWGKVARALLSLEYFSFTGTCVLGANFVVSFDSTSSEPTYSCLCGTKQSCLWSHLMILDIYWQDSVQWITSALFLKECIYKSWSSTKKRKAV